MCNVEDFFLEYLAKTLAALPVGASNTDRFPMLGSDFTRAEINVVFPVPAYPFRRKIPVSYTHLRAHETG